MAKEFLKVGISCFAGHGGSGVVASELGKALAAMGHEVHFITTELPFRIGQLSERLQFHPVRPMPYPVFPSTPYTLALATTMAEVTMKHHLDIIHCHYAIPHSTAAYLARHSCGCSMREVTTLHGTDTRLVGLDPSYRHIVRWSIEQSHIVTAVSDYLRQSSITDLELTRDIVVLPNFVDTQLFHPARCPHMRSSLAADGEPVVVNVSNLRPVKRVLDVIRAHALITAATGARLVVVGNGPQREEAEQLACELGISHKVTFLGMQDEVARFLGAADLYLQASSEESFGMAALESMACGLPVVAMSVGGLPGTVVDGETGFLTPPGQVELLAEAAIRLLRDDDLRRSMGEAARRRAVEVFDTRIVVPQYVAQYHAARELPV